MSYETGASSHAANDLILSIQNDGTLCETLQRMAAADIAGRRQNWRAAVNAAAQEYRKTGAKFKASDITEAARIIRQDTIAGFLEELACQYDKSRFIQASCRRWLDKYNGNSYFSVKISLPLNNGNWQNIVMPFRYGYEDQWKFDAISRLIELGIFDGKDARKRHPHDYPVTWEDEGYGLKKNMY